MREGGRGGGGERDSGVEFVLFHPFGILHRVLLMARLDWARVKFIHCRVVDGFSRGYAEGSGRQTKQQQQQINAVAGR